MFSSVKNDIGVNKTEDNAFRQIIIPSLTLTDEGFNDDGVWESYFTSHRRDDMVTPMMKS